MIVTDVKDPEEIVDLSFDFTDDLGAADITPGTPAVAVALLEGVDADPGGTIQGAPVIQGKVVFQRMRLGAHRAQYRYRCKISASDGRVLVLSMQVPVRTI